MTVELFKPSVSDAKRLHDLICSTFRETELKWVPENDAVVDDYMAETYFLEETQKSLEDPKTHWRILSIEGEWVGFFQLILKKTIPGLPNQSVAQARKMYLKSNVQKQGYGQVMFDEVFKICHEYGVKTVWCNVYCRNENSIALAKKFGAKKISEEPIVYKRNGETIKEHSINYFIKL